MIYTITFNPALDYVIYLDRLMPGETNRCKREELYFGGKGINVSLVLKELGAESVALGFAAGFTGDALVQYLADAGIKADFIRLKEGLTRINVKLKGEAETEINACGPAVSTADLDALFAKLEQLETGDLLVLAGSVPPSVPADIYSKIAKRMAEKKIRFVTDATGALLKGVLPYHPFLIKPNHRELEELVARPLQGSEAIAEAARELQKAGAQNVLVSRGKEGALLLDEQGELYEMPALGGKPVNTVGAGDSMVAGFLAGIEKGYEYALRLGSAAGGATACSPALAKKAEIEALL